jgi:hypothetical protein
MGQEYRNTAIYTAFDDHEQPELVAAERNLLRAVLMNAVADVNRPGDYSRKAREYFLSREEDYLFSFQSVCSYLNINPRHILILVGLDETIPSPLAAGGVRQGMSVDSVESEGFAVVDREGLGEDGA